MSMGDKFDKLFEKMKEEFQKQTIDITDNLTTNLSRRIDERLRPIVEENTLLNDQIIKLERRVEFLERDSKRNNIIFFGMEETEDNITELLENMMEKIADDINIKVEKSEINNVYRVGKRNSENNKPRPVVVSFVNAWRRDEVLRNKKKFIKVRVSEDYPKAVQERRKLWKSEIKEERNNGKIAYLVYDKLLVKPRDDKKEIDKPSTSNATEEKNKASASFYEIDIENRINKLFQDKPQKRKIPSHY